MQTLKLQVEELLAKTQILTFASIDEKGYPRPVPMAKIHTEGIRTLSSGLQLEQVLQKPNISDIISKQEFPFSKKMTAWYWILDISFFRL